MPGRGVKRTGASAAAVNKRDLSEADIRSKFTTPAIVGPGKRDLMTQVAAKVEQRMFLVDALETHLTASRATAGNILTLDLCPP